MGLEQARIIPQIIPPRLIFCGTITNTNPNGQLRVRQPLEIGDSMFVPFSLKNRYLSRMRRFERVLFNEMPNRTHYDEEERDYRRLSRDLVLDLFPALRDIFIHEQEQRLFHGKTVEIYVQEAFEQAKEFRDWLIKNHLPPNLWQRFELLEEVHSAQNIFDLLKMHTQSEEMPYDQMRNQQIVSLLELAYLFSFQDLTRDPRERKLLDRFSKLSGEAFPRTDMITLALTLNHEGKCKQCAIHTEKSDSMIRAQSISRRGMLSKDFRVRYFGQTPNEFVIFHQREKDDFPTMLKVIRGRRIPPPDLHAARFIVGDKKHSTKFLQTLAVQLPEWEIQKEEVETRTHSSMLPYKQEKYFVWQKNDAGAKIELVVDWLTDNDRPFEGSWIYYCITRGSSFQEFRIRQLLEGPLQKILPHDIYGFDWNSPENIQGLSDYAYQQAIEQFTAS